MVWDTSKAFGWDLDLKGFGEFNMNLSNNHVMTKSKGRLRQAHEDVLSGPFIASVDLYEVN